MTTTAEPRPAPRRDRLHTYLRRLTAAGAQARRRLHPAVAAVTPLGWGAAAVALACWLLSRREGWQEFTVIAVALTAALAASVFFLIGRSQYEVALDLRSERVVVGEPATGRLVVRNGTRARLLPVRMELPVGSAVASLPIPGLARETEHEEIFRIPTQRRAVLVLGPVRSVRGDAFGLVRRVVRWTDPELLYVHPRTVPLIGTAAGFIRDLEGEATRHLSNSDISFHALRGYVPGDDRRYIHWKTSARTGTLMVRQFEETRRSHLALALSANPADYADDDEFELAVAACASLGVQSARDERAFTAVTHRRAMAAGTGRRLLDQLAGLEAAPEAPQLVELSRHAATAVPAASVAIMICGSTPDPADIRRAAAHFPLGIRVIAIRAVTGAAISVRTIGNADVVTVGHLDDLARGLRGVRA